MADAPTAQQAIDVLLYDDINSVRSKKLLIDMRKLAENVEWAEDFLEKGGLDTLLRLAKNTSGNVQGILLQAVRALLVYVNALDRFGDSPDLVERMFALLYPPEPGAPVNLTVAKAALELLIVVCGKLPDGHQLINEAAKKKTGVDVHPYANFAALLTSNDLICVGSTLLLMNLLMTKRKAADELAGKRLFFRWQQAGLMALLEPLEAIDDKTIQTQLSLLQRSTGYTIPRSWVEAHKYKTQYQDLKRKYDAANEQLFVFQQQQAKVRLMKLEFARAQTTLRALGVVMPSLDTTPHPTKRFTDGGGIALQQLRNPDTEPLELDVTTLKETADIQRKLMTALMQQPDLASIAEAIVAPKLSKRPTMGRHADPFAPPPIDEDFPPPPDDDDDDDVDLPPPDDDDDDDLPPPDDEAPPVGQPVGPKSGGGAASDAPPPSADGGAPGSGGAAASSSGADPTQSSGVSQSAAAPTAQIATPPNPVSLGDAQVTAGAAGSRPAGAPPPPPPPPPPGKKGGPPPPPPGKGFGVAAKAPERAWYKGPAPSKKMRPLHWDKWALDGEQETESVWGQIHRGEVQCEFNFEEFETMFSQKEVDVKAPKEKKPEKVLLVDAKTYQNLSIMLHKLPTIPTIQNALLTLDGDTLEPQMIMAMMDSKLLTPEVYKTFNQKINEKPVEEYEPPEQFIAMTLSVPEFSRRCNAWLFTMEWNANIASALKPISRMNAAITSILAAKHLPYFMGLLLGFGNVMNYGNATKGNAPAISITTLGKLDASKDNRGKVSLLQHMIETARLRNPDALELHEELRPLFDNVTSLKYEDLDKSVAEAEKSLSVFHRDVAVVRKALEAAGTASEDPFIPYTAEFNARAAEEIEKLKSAFEATKELCAKLLKYLGVPRNKPMKPEEIIAELYPFADRIRQAAAEAAKDKKRLARKGQKLDSDITNVLGALQNELIAGTN